MKPCYTSSFRVIKELINMLLWSLAPWRSDILLSILWSEESKDRCAYNPYLWEVAADAILKRVRLEKDINCISLVLDQWLFESYYHHMQSWNHVAISKVMLSSSVNSSSDSIMCVNIETDEAKVISVTYSIYGFALAYGSIVMGPLSLGGSALLSVSVIMLKGHPTTSSSS